MAYYDHGLALHNKECKDQYDKLKKFINSSSEWNLADEYLEDLEKTIKDQKLQIEEYEKFFLMLKNLLPKQNNIL
jgi:hypothetical protein